MSLHHDIIRQLTLVYPQGEATALVRMLFEERFGLSLTDLLLGKDNDLSAKQRTELQNIVARLQKNEPIQYILGETEFCGLTLAVAPGVLIPRPETAELVQWISECHSTGQVLDIGTGSGCIALALAHRGYCVEAWDISDDALAIARRNAERLSLDVRFKKEDILHIEETPERYDIIVSNPPYICRKEAADMERNVLDYEPHTALFVPDEDPLLFYRAITHFATSHLASGGMLFFEINRAYASETCLLLKEKGFTEIETRQDQFGNPRMVRAILKR